MSELQSRFRQLLSEEGIKTSNYKSLYLPKSIEKRFRNKLSFWRSNDNSSYIHMQFLCYNVPKGQIIGATLESMKQNKSSDFEVQDLLQLAEDVNVDGIPRHVYYTAKAIRRLTLSEIKSSVPWSPTCSFINEQSVTKLQIPNFLFSKQENPSVI